MTTNQMGFLVNVDRCIGCHTCAVACKEQNDLEVGPRWRRVRVVEGGSYPKPFAYSVSLGCGHCAEPICGQVCPVGAYTKRADGLVVHDATKCIGCKYCTFACPYAAPQYDEAAGKAGKCSGCASLVDQGQQPACVQSCIVRALEFGLMEDLQRKYPTAVRSLPVMPEPKTNPSVLYKPKAEVGTQPARIIDGHRTRTL